MRKLSTLMLLFIGALVMTPAPAWAHQGAGPTVTVSAGPYTIAAYDPAISPTGSLSYRAVVWVTATGAALDDAEITVAVQRIGPDAGTPIPPQKATASANTYRWQLPDPGDGAYRVSAGIDAPSGKATAMFTVHGLPEPTHSVNLLAVGVPIAAVVAVFIGVCVVVRRRSRAGRASGSPEPLA